MSDGAETINAIHKIRKDDIIIAFMGPTGAGKSYFIDLLTGQKGRRAGSSLKSVTSQIQATRVKHPGYDDRIVLVDTPGFDDTTRSDMEILQIISEWLQKTYSKQVKLSGLIYLHRITDNRMAGSPHKNLRMFGELCGDVAMTQVRLVSTMWGKVKPEVGEGRERELRDKFWMHFIDKGSKIERLKDTTKEEAWRIVDQLIRDSKKRDAILLQEELVELEKQLNETAAGKTLYTSLQKLLADQKESLRSLVAQVEKSNDPNLTKELKKEYARINDQFQRTFQEVTKLKIPIGKRIMLFIFGKKTRAKAIKVSEA
ncbi:hypothetical protein AGABI1DRAFT_114372 [Agaricus bisporus var. burnettii JB137-S8]|uniref:G domain-containing protein n=1 Tax=Agaricus bisporus var. burnettii (strain JB137-S8 / ATCC MYA-4627 / FGSC 10392) TaxID=597362 RepID=K5XUK5_AGABU|nr:uncharacterized protein AGABI1DRAFT_114372 [Agaricus bisporus var. burnettii JB137-S8]EKM78780.1 hypothetical protein AGABI1DRAFT_114372 [Agaricus bisporus var. burnettii JB137-S8]